MKNSCCIVRCIRLSSRLNFLKNFITIRQICFLKSDNVSSIRWVPRPLTRPTRRFISHRQWLTQGGYGGRTPPPEIGKIFVEIWCYLPEVYTFGAESEIQEIFSKNCEKSSKNRLERGLLKMA